MATTTSIATTLGAGSGIDIKSLVASLVEAQYATKTGQLTARAEKLTAQISGVAKLKNAITGFDTALKSLVKGGTLSAQPTSSNTGVLTVSALPGAKLGGLSATVSVEQLAQAQAATTNAPVSATAGFRGGTLTVAIGSYATDANGVQTLSATRTVPITIAQGATLEQVAEQIKSATGLQATLASDGDGLRLTVKGATGAGQAFEVTGTDTDAAAEGLGLAALSVGPNATGTTVGVAARNATIVVDGARFSRAGNSVRDLVPGVKLDLVAVSTTPVTLGATTSSSALSQAVADVVETFNEVYSIVKEETNAATGPLARESAAAGVARTMGQLTTTKLATSTTNGPQTLADIGVKTNRDGTLSLDTPRLTRLLTDDPSGVEALFADGAGATGGGLSAALSAIKTRLTDRTFGLDAATTRYTRQQGEIGKEQAKATAAAAALSTRMTQQFAAMDSRVAAYKSTQTFLENQIKAWNRTD